MPAAGGRHPDHPITFGRVRLKKMAPGGLDPWHLAGGRVACRPMSAAAVVNHLEISQSGRWYEYRWGAEGPPLEPDQIARNSANTHCLPATPELCKKLLAVRRHDLVVLEGYLVEIVGPDDYRWRSSLTRDDTGGSACEVVWLTALDSQPIPTPAR